MAGEGTGVRLQHGRGPRPSSNASTSWTCGRRASFLSPLRSLGRWVCASGGCACGVSPGTASPARAPLPPVQTWQVRVGGPLPTPLSLPAVDTAVGSSPSSLPFPLNHLIAARILSFLGVRAERGRPPPPPSPPHALGAAAVVGGLSSLDCSPCTSAFTRFQCRLCWGHWGTRAPPVGGARKERYMGGAWG